MGYPAARRPGGKRPAAVEGRRRDCGDDRADYDRSQYWRTRPRNFSSFPPATGKLCLPRSRWRSLQAFWDCRRQISIRTCCGEATKTISNRKSISREPGNGRFLIDSRCRANAERSHAPTSRTAASSYREPDPPYPPAVTRLRAPQACGTLTTRPALASLSK